MLTTNLTIGRHVLVNLNVTIGHDCVIGHYVTFSPGDDFREMRDRRPV